MTMCEQKQMYVNVFNYCNDFCMWNFLAKIPCVTRHIFITTDRFSHKILSFIALHVFKLNTTAWCLECPVPRPVKTSGKINPGTRVCVPQKYYAFPKKTTGGRYTRVRPQSYFLEPAPNCGRCAMRHV